MHFLSHITSCWLDHIFVPASWQSLWENSWGIKCYREPTWYPPHGAQSFHIQCGKITKSCCITWTFLRWGDLSLLPYDLTKICNDRTTHAEVLEGLWVPVLLVQIHSGVHLFSLVWCDMIIWFHDTFQHIQFHSDLGLCQPLEVLKQWNPLLQRHDLSDVVVKVFYHSWHYLLG